MECSHCHYQSQAEWKSCPVCGVEVSQGFFTQIKKMFFKPAPSGPAVRPTGKVSVDSLAKLAFSLKVEEIFMLREGLTVAGKVAGGAICKGEEVIIQSASGTSRSCRILAIKKFRKVVDVGNIGDNVGLVLSDLSEKDVAPHDIIKK